MSDRKFSEAFAANMKRFNMSVPDGIFTGAGQTLAITTGLAGGLAVAGDKATVAQLIAAVKATPGIGASTLKISGVAGSVLASAYVGGLLASLVLALDETENDSSVTEWLGQSVWRGLASISAILGKPISEVVAEAAGLPPSAKYYANKCRAVENRRGILGGLGCRLVAPIAFAYSTR